VPGKSTHVNTKLQCDFPLDGASLQPEVGEERLVCLGLLAGKVAQDLLALVHECAEGALVRVIFAVGFEVVCEGANFVGEEGGWGLARER
jgi:hypothetical protein